MSVGTMKKLDVIALRADADKMIRKLMWLGCVQVERADLTEENDSDMSVFSCETEKSEHSKNLASVELALSNISKLRKGKGLFSKPHEVSVEQFDSGVSDEVLELARAINNTVTHISELKASVARYKDEISALSVWENYDLPLSTASTEETVIRLGTFPGGTDIETVISDLAEYLDEFDIMIVNTDKNAVYTSVIYHLSINDRINRMLTEHGFSKIEFKDKTDTPTAEIEKLRHNISESERKIIALQGKMTEYAKLGNDLEIARDILKTDYELSDAKQLMLSSQDTVYLSAWTPERAQKNVGGTLDKFNCWYQFGDPAEEDDVPVELINNPFATPFESVVTMYSYPKYKTFDPTMIMSIFYFIIFGLMLGDVAYGLILSVGGFLAVKLMKPKGGMKKLITLFAICGISCIIAGVVFGSYFGDLPAKMMVNMFGVAEKDVPKIALLFDPMQNPMGLLIISLAVGVIHLFTGMGIKFYVLCKEGRPLDAIFDIGSWYVFFIGIGLLAVVPGVGKYVAIAGAAMLVLTQGRAQKNIIMKFLMGLYSLYDSISYLSDLLSYSRIMALGLASVVIASVVNLLGTMGGFIGVIIAILIGHILNLAINLLGTFVHTSRLQYIEFFGKFFEDGGRPFKPVVPQMKYTEINENEIK